MFDEACFFVRVISSASVLLRAQLLSLPKMEINSFNVTIFIFIISNMHVKNITEFTTWTVTIKIGKWIFV